MPPGTMMLLLVAMASACLGHLGVVFVRTLAARGHMLDSPGANRMHALPIPRGGGVGFAVALLLIGLGPNLAIAQVDHWQNVASWMAVAVGLIAVVGWIDDHQGLPAWPRLAVHLLAGACIAVAWWLGVPSGVMMSTGTGVGVGALIALAVTASVNLHNFLDGADGLLATQALFVMIAFACLASSAGHMPLAIISVATAASIVGFLPHNAPRARVFMGDVGSGTLGLAIAATATFAVRDELLTLPAAVLLISGCLIDTGMTLTSRILRGRAFWRRHHEHAYQWLIRTGWSHPQVAAAWIAWNLAVVLPAFLFALREPASGWILVAIVYAFGMSIWLWSKRRLARRARCSR